MVPRQNNVWYHQNSFRLESILIGHLKVPKLIKRSFSHFISLFRQKFHSPSLRALCEKFRQLIQIQSDPGDMKLRMKFTGIQRNLDNLRFLPYDHFRKRPLSKTAHFRKPVIFEIGHFWKPVIFSKTVSFGKRMSQTLFTNSCKIRRISIFALF